MKHSAYIMMLLMCLHFVPFSFAETETLPDIVVEEKAILEDKKSLSIKSEALPAQVQVVTGEDIKRLNVTTPVDLFRKVPGVYLEHYQQGDIGSAITMRGLGGGGGGRRYVAVYVDGVQQNFAINNLDHILAWITPEMIERIEVIKGPFSALYGNMAIGGAINIVTKTFDEPSVRLAAGTYGTFQGSGVLSTDQMKITPFLNAEYYTTDGYRDNSEYWRVNSFNKISVPLWKGTMSFSFDYYDAEWNASGYLWVNDVRNDVLSRKSTLTPDDGGENTQFSFVANYRPPSEQGLYITAYYHDVEHHRFVGFPITINSAYNQQERIFDASALGARAYYNFVYGNRAAFTLGLDGRYEDGVAERYPTKKQIRTGAASQDWNAQISQAGFFFQGQVKPFDVLKIVGGLRYDSFDFEIDNRKNPANSGSGSPSIFCPKIGLVLSPFTDVNMFTNIGKGFRTPYISELSPVSTTQRKNFDLDPPEADTWDIGFNAMLFKKLYVAFDYYETDIKREIATVKDEPVNIGDSHRDGFEVEMKYYVMPTMAVYGSYSWVDAKLDNPTVPGQTRVIDVPKEMITGGIELTHQLGNGKQLMADLYYNYAGGKYYYVGRETDPMKGPAFDRYNLKITYHEKPFSIDISGTCAPRKASSEITWLNGTALMITPVAQLDFMVGVRYAF